MIIWILAFSQLLLGSNEVVVRSPDGEIEIQELCGNETFVEVVEILKAGYGSEEIPLIDFMQKKAETPVSREYAVGTPRNYSAPLSNSEKEDISYIVTNLGMSSLAKIAKQKSSLKKVGKKVDHVHPFNFLYTIFHDEKNRAAVHAMRDRSWVWDGFYDGLKGSLTEEASRDNLNKYVDDFSARLGVDPASIAPSVKDQDWNQLIKILLKLLPRTGDAGRYDM